MKKLILGILLFSFLSIQANDSFLRGADISWLQQQEATGYKFYDINGVEKDCMVILKENGINSLRFRVFVNPSDDPIDGHCSKEDLLPMLVRAKNLDFKIMISLHYSDSWADPSKQTVPAAWSSYNTIEQLETAVSNHTKEVLTYFRENGDVTPTWVGIGNETPDGMLWPLGRITVNGYGNFSKLITAGHKAVKEFDSSITTFVHMQNAAVSSTWFYDGIRTAGAQYDMIGLSFYPHWSSPSGEVKDCAPLIAALQTNVNNCKSRYNKPVMIVETGTWDWLPDVGYQMIKDLIAAMQNSKAEGVFYWEPQGDRAWSRGYNLSCWSNNRPTRVLSAFKPESNQYLYMGLGSNVNAIADYSNKLISKNLDGIYEGFFYAQSSWQNFFLTPQENASSTIYGSVPNNRFSLDSSTSRWSLWLDEGTGLHYIKADLNEQTWSFTPMVALNIYGDFNSWNATSNPLTWNSSNKSYTTTVHFTAANSSFKFVPTGTDSSLWDYQLGSGNESNELIINGGVLTNSVAGEHLVTINLSDPTKYTYSISSIATGLSDINLSSSEYILSVANNELYINGGENKEYNIAILNTVGHIVKQLQKSLETPISITELPKGVYLLKIDNKTTKFIKH